MSQLLITCPSGLVGEIRGLKAKEANMFTDPSFQRSGSALDQVLSSCWVKTVEGSIYPADSKEHPIWNKVLLCDRFYALMMIRIATYGNLYDFSLQCPEAACRLKFDWSINLNDLDVRMLPKSSAEAYLHGNKFASPQTLGGRNVWFQLMNGETEQRANARIRQDKQRGSGGRLATLALASRIVEIEGVEPNDKLAWLEELDMGEVTAFIDVMDSVDGGVNSTVEVECPHCGSILDVQLPFDRQFWVPRKKKPASTNA